MLCIRRGFSSLYESYSKPTCPKQCVMFWSLHWVVAVPPIGGRWAGIWGTVGRFVVQRQSSHFLTVGHGLLKHVAISLGGSLCLHGCYDAPPYYFNFLRCRLFKVDSVLNTYIALFHTLYQLTNTNDIIEKIICKFSNERTCNTQEGRWKA